MKRSTLTRGAVPAAVVLSFALAACGGEAVPDEEAAPADGASAEAGGDPGGELSGEIITDGSSTVQPLTAAAGELFAAEEPGVNVSVATSGTGGGFEVFCLGQTDMSNASRVIAEDEVAACEENGVEFTEVVIANDALSVVVSQENDFADCLTVEELQTMWAPESEGQITTWDQINPEFPAEPIELYGAGTDSGTFDYFTDAINGEEGASRADYNAAEDDNITVQGVGGSPYAIGYFGLSYLLENSDTLKGVAIDNGEGCVEPSGETALDGTYTPLARELYVYVNNESYASKPELQAFMDFYVENEPAIAEAADFIPLTDEQITVAQEELASLTG